MPALDDTVEEVLATFDGTETYDEAEFALRDYPSKEISVTAARRVVALETGVLPPGSVAAADVSFAPAGTIAATDVQAAIAEVAAEAASGGWPTLNTILSTTIPAADSGSWSFYYTGQTAFRFRDSSTGWIEFPVALQAGTWALAANVQQGPYAPFVTASLNDGNGLVEIDQSPYGASAATIDLYNVSEVIRYMAFASDITIADDGYYTLRLAMDGHNASSSAYQFGFANVCLSKVG